MSTLTLISPVASIVRPLISFGLLASIAIVFKPLISGLLRAAILMIKPSVKSALAIEQKRVQGMLSLQRMARDLDRMQPGMAAEIRHLSCRM